MAKHAKSLPHLMRQTILPSQWMVETESSV